MPVCRVIGPWVGLLGRQGGIGGGGGGVMGVCGRGGMGSTNHSCMYFVQP